MKMALTTDQEKKLFIVQVVCLVILWAFITPLRVWSRILTKRGRAWKDLPWVEDALMLAALVIQFERHHSLVELTDGLNRCYIL